MKDTPFYINKESVDKLFPKEDIFVSGYEPPINLVMGQLQMEVENGIYKAIQKCGVDVDKVELEKALQYDREQYEMGYFNGYRAGASNGRLYEALTDIVWYDNHSDWLREACSELEKAKKEGTNYCIPDIEWHTEMHTIWMLLTGMFGDWGTSIRSGWIEDIDGCIEFIQGLIRDANDEDLEDGDY